MPDAAVQPGLQSSNSTGSAGAGIAEKPASIVAYVDSRPEGVVPHALAMASALNAAVSLLKVLAQPDGAIPTDPVMWRMRRQVARDMLKRAAEDSMPAGAPLEVNLAEGQPAEQLSKWVREHKVELMVLGIGEAAPGEREGVDIALRLLERGSGNLLLVPANAATRKVSYRRIVLSLDGSTRAESVLPFALRIAKGAGAELILAHVVPVPELTGAGPLEAADYDLQEKVASRNERAAHRYLEHIRARLLHDGVAVRTVILRDRDARGALASIAASEKADLVIMSSHGNSGRMDCACGSVAYHMLKHASTALLLVPRLPSRSSGEKLPFRNMAGRHPGRLM